MFVGVDIGIVCVVKILIFVVLVVFIVIVLSSGLRIVIVNEFGWNRKGSG